MHKVLNLISATYVHDMPAVSKILDTFSLEEIEILCQNMDILHSVVKHHLYMNPEKFQKEEV